MPTVSVVIPTYNRAEYILDAIESVLSQTFTDYEITVIDDGSVDATSDVLQHLIVEGKIRYVFQENQGVSAARNYGIRLSEGKYIAFLDSDDLWHPNKLEKLVDVLDVNSDIALVQHSFCRVNEDGSSLGYRDTSRFSGRVYPAILLDWSVLIPPSCVVIRAKMLDEVGNFDESMHWGEDIDLWRRVAKHHPIAAVQEVLTTMRVHSNNASGAKIQLGTVRSFEYYLTKAFSDDPQLSKRFRRRALAKMYSNFGHNVLAEGERDLMKLARQYSIRSIQQWPFQVSAYLGWLGSFLSTSLRDRLLAMWRNYRDRR
ncbi:MAG: glycosyltransferase family 2 protein [Anaerolineales bacterium]|nr:glycosyltransferase family 2 protein [Chloroflexota bacterium]MBL6980211.1 glycosyltransferase family 2 protein [Anaerolineales bacterium]